MEKILFLKKVNMTFCCDVKSFSEHKVQFVISQSMYNGIERDLIKINADILELPSGKISVIVRKENSDFELIKNMSTYEDIVDAINILSHVVDSNNVLFNNPGICTTEKNAADNIKIALLALRKAKYALIDLGYDK